MKKRWISLCAAGLLLLTACGAETPSPSDDTPQTTVTHTTRPLTSEVTVTDAYAGELTVGDATYTYRVPQVSVSGQPLTALNEKIYTEMYDGVLTNQVYAHEGETSWTRMDYTWGENDDVVSVVIRMTDAVTGRDTFIAYSASKETGDVITDRSAIASGYGLTVEMLDTEVAAALEMEYVMTYQAKIAEVGQAAYDEKLQTMLTDMPWRAVPFVNAAGDLCAVTDMASFGDADYYKILINVTGATEVTF